MSARWWAAVIGAAILGGVIADVGVLPLIVVLIVVPVAVVALALIANSRRHRPDAAEAPTPPPTPRPPTYRVWPEYVIHGPELASTPEGTVTIPLVGLPDGITSIRLVSGHYVATYPIDLDGLRHRNPAITNIIVHYTP